MNKMLLTAAIPPNLLDTVIVLIPKKRVTEAFGDFRPISLCDMVYKFFAKLLCNRLDPFLPKLVSLNQGTFIWRRSIFDNVSLAQEAYREIGRPGDSLNHVLSLDMHKVYDRLECDFLGAVLHKMGFSEHWNRVTTTCIGGCKFSVMFNGKLGNNFVATRGLWQGDPLSPSLFILVEEVLSRGLYTHLDRVDAFTTTLAQCPSHLLFADDFILFVCTKKRSIMKMMGVIKAYCLTSGQALNPSKCKFFLPSDVPLTRVCCEVCH